MSGTVDNVELAKMRNVSTHQIYNKRKALGLTENNKPLHDPVDTTRARAPWTMEEDEIVKMMCDEGRKDKEIAEYIGRSVVAVENRRNKLHREGLMSSLTNVKNDSRLFTKQDEPVQAKEVQTKTEVSLLWGMVKFTKA
jgi:DNA-binding NarL/FixJ family response regulator